MSSGPERFLPARTRLSQKAALGRVFNVTRETWRLSDDPQVTAPAAELIVSRHTASEAADLARAAAKSFPRNGYHKPSANWWGADDVHFHRFVVHAGRRRQAVSVAVASGLLGLAGLALWRRSVRNKRQASEAGRPEAE